MKLTAEQQIQNSIKSYSALLNHISTLRVGFTNPWDICDSVESFVRDEINRLKEELEKQPLDIKESLKNIEDESIHLSELLEEVALVSSKLQEVVKTINEEVK